MGNEKGKIGKLFVMFIIILVILGVCGIMFSIVNSKEENYLTKPPKEEKEKIEIKSKYNSFEKVLSELDYSKIDNGISKNIALITDYNADKDILVSMSTGKVILNQVEFFEWYGTFGIASDEEYDYILNEKGNILYYTDDMMVFYPEAKKWSYVDDDHERVYKQDGELFDSLDTYIIDDEGLYYYTISDKLKIYDYNKRLIYEQEIEEGDSAYVLAGSSSYEDVYASIVMEDIEENAKSSIINLKEGNIVYTVENTYLDNIGDNLFDSDGRILFVYKDRIPFDIKGKLKEYNLGDKYVNINGDIYDLRYLRKTDDLVYIPESHEDNLIQRENELEITACLKGLSIKYGLKHKGEEILACEYDDIEYYDYNLYKALLKSNKLYVIVTEGTNYYTYDVYNKKKTRYLGSYGVVASTYENEDSYFANILTNKSVNNKNGEYLFDSGDNYYILTDEDRTYYDFYDANSFKKFYEVNTGYVVSK